MNILDRIIELRDERGWTEYRLATEAGLPQSTISTWYRRNITPTVDSLEKICSAFGITLSQFFMVETEEDVAISVTNQQVRLLHYAAKLNPKQFESLLQFLETI